jgi:hypothetical protein
MLSKGSVIGVGDGKLEGLRHELDPSYW